jgi:hypothetical protein
MTFKVPPSNRELVFGPPSHYHAQRSESQANSLVYTNALQSGAAGIVSKTMQE